MMPEIRNTVDSTILVDLCGAGSGEGVGVEAVSLLATTSLGGGEGDW